MITARQNYTTQESVIISRICKLLNQIDICIIRRHGHESDLQRRPLTTRQNDLEGGLWFFSKASSQLINLYGSAPQVTVAVSCPILKKCAALSGEASIVSQNSNLAHSFIKANASLLPSNYDPSRLTLLRVEVAHAEFWEWPEETLIHSTVALTSQVATPDQKRTHDGQRSSVS